MSPDLVRQDIERSNWAEQGLIAALLEIQTKYGYLPEQALRNLAIETGRSLVEVYGVATFYRAFSLKPRGKHLVSCCLGTACHVRAAPTVAEELEKLLGVPPGETTPDEEFTFETVNCLGACALGPIVVIDGHYFSQVNTTMVSEILKKARTGLDAVDISTDKRYFPLALSCPHCNHGLLDPSYLIDNQPSVKVTISYGDQHGWLRLSSLYGSFSSKCEVEVPLEKVIQLFCPHCNAELIGADLCLECGQRMGTMAVAGGGSVQFCPRHGCKGHILNLG